MRKTLTSILFSLSVIFFPFMFSGVGSAAISCPVGSSAAKCSVCVGLNSINQGQSCSTGNTGASSLVSTIVDLLSLVVGIVAVIMLIISGLRFVFSGGDSNKVGQAKTALIYALVGLVIVGLAQVLVHWVLNTSVKIAH